MSAASNGFKLGLLTIAVIASIAAISLALALQLTPEETVPFHSYFDESVVGLERGAPVKYRGITVGNVAKIAFAPDGRLVEVTSEIRKEHVARLHWSPAKDDGLRIRIGTPGLAGSKLLDMEYVDPVQHPPVVLPFAPPEHYLPAAPSLMGGLEKTVETVRDAVVAALARVERLVAEIERNELPQQTAVALASVQQAASELRGAVRSVNDARLAARAGSSLVAIDDALAKIERVVTRVDADGGLLSRAEEATESVQALGDRAGTVTGELDRTVRDLGDAARSVRGLADAIERDPDMLLKGKSKAKGGSR